MKFVSEGSNSLEDKIVFVAIPSIGSVSQLTIDLLINSFKAKRIGFLYSKNIISICGNDPFSDKLKGEIHTSIEGKPLN